MADLSADPARLRARPLAPIVVSAALLLLLLLAGGEGPRVAAAQDVLVASQHGKRHGAINAMIAVLAVGAIIAVLHQIRGFFATVGPRHYDRRIAYPLPLMMEVRRQWARFVDLSSWDARKPCSKWAFVTCNKRTGEVRRIDVAKKGIEGPLPSVLGNISTLFQFFANDNGITGPIPESFGQLTQLQQIVLRNNRITGPLPRSMGKLSSLWEMQLQSNQIRDVIPTTWKGMTGLGNFYIADNQIQGPLPTELCQMTSLQRIRFGNNQITGPIPSCIGNLKDMVNFYMDNNRMTGVIPASIGNFTKAVNFFINGNFIDGPIPSTVGSMTSLDTLFLSGNWIKGPLPSTIGNLKNLKHFIMEFNNISGPIPSTIGDMVKCERILLDNNYLTGVIPPTISKLTNLVWLFLQGNFLEGEVPVGITKLPNLFYFNLASNRLSGTANWDFTNAAIKGGEVNVRSNYFYGTPSFTAAGKPFCPITKTSKMNGLDQIFLSSSKFNCFTFPPKYPCPGFNEPGYSSPAVCKGFCGASSPQGTCNGLGYCSKTSSVVGGWGCVCEAGATLAPNGTWCLPGKGSTYGKKSMTFLRG
ncbi:unnamed protein product [Closterium sp. Naga37s-1]|nr:unnamed protein product [Closterium sp. Naga37s-1]